MKKSMFITSVIMVVVLAIALTTSSLAWYNGAAGAQNVTAGSLTVSAQQAAAGKGLVISTDGASFGTETVTLGLAVTGMTPAAPLNCPGDDEKAELTASILNELDADDETLAFGNVALIPGDTSEGKVPVKAAGVKVSVSNVVYVASTGAAITPNITVNFTVDPADDDAAVLWVAVLAYNAKTSAWQIVTIASSKTLAMTTFEGAAADSADLRTLLSQEFDHTAASWDQIQLAAAGDSAWGTPVQYKAVAWYDGASLKNSNSDTSISYSITFTDPNPAWSE